MLFGPIGGEYSRWLCVSDYARVCVCVEEELDEGRKERMVEEAMMV